MNIQAKYKKDWIKTEAAHSILKQVDGQTDNWGITDGAASDKLHWLCQEPLMSWLVPYVAVSKM